MPARVRPLPQGGTRTATNVGRITGRVSSARTPCSVAPLLHHWPSQSLSAIPSGAAIHLRLPSGVDAVQFTLDLAQRSSFAGHLSSLCRSVPRQRCHYSAVLGASQNSRNLMCASWHHAYAAEPGSVWSHAVL